MTVALSGLDAMDVELPYEAYADGKVWQRARKVSAFMVGLVVTQLIAWAFFPSEFDRVQLWILGLSLAVYSFGLWWYHRTVRRVRRAPVVRIDADALSVQLPESSRLRAIPWGEVEQIAWRGLDEIGVRLHAARGEIAEVVSIPIAQLPVEAADHICAAITAREGD